MSTLHKFEPPSLDFCFAWPSRNQPRLLVLGQRRKKFDVMRWWKIQSLSKEEAGVDALNYLI